MIFELIPWTVGRKGMTYDRAWSVEGHLTTLLASRLPEPIAVHGLHLRVDTKAIPRRPGVVAASYG